MSAKLPEIDPVKVAEWLGVDPSDLANYTLALFFLNLNKQGTFTLKPEGKAKLEAIVRRLEPKIEPSVEKIKERRK